MVNADILQAAIAAHASWKARLRTALGTGKIDVEVGPVRKDDQCQFGKWLYGSELSAAEKGAEHYRAVKQLHAQFHQQAANVIELATSNRKDEAEKAMSLTGDYTRASAELTKAVTRWRDSL